MSLARERPNLLVTRTFSKAHGLCGLRVGYGVGSAMGRGHRQGAPALQHERPRPGRRAGEPAAPTPTRPARAGGRRGARARGARAGLAEPGLLAQPGQLYPGAAGLRSGRRILRCPRAAAAPRRHRARRRRAGLPGAPEGLHRDPGRERGIPFGACAARPLRQPRETETQDGQAHDDRDAAGRHRGAGAATSSSASSRRAPARIPRAASSSRSSAPSATTARSSPQLQLEGEPGVEKVVPILKPYKLVSSDFRGSDATVTSPAGASAAASSASSPGPAPWSRASRRWPPPAPARRPARPTCAAAPTSRAPRPTPSQGLGKPGLEILAEAREETGPADRDRGHGPAAARGRARGGRHDPARRAQHAELRPAARGRAAPASRCC